MTPLQAGRSGAAASRPAVRPVAAQVPVDRAQGPGDGLPPNGPASAELDAMLEPMLGAIVRMAGADAGIVRVIGADGACYEPVVATGIPGAAADDGAHALAAWCAACAESRDASSECVTSKICGHDERLAADVVGPVCKHIVAVPLRHKDRSVGTLGLMFETERVLPAAMTPLLQATGDLLGMTLDNARLARENLRTCLTNERHMMANEVHDSLAQGLTYMRMRMSLLRDAIRRDDEPARAQVLERRRRHARQLAAPVARADHLFSQPDGSARPAARAVRNQRALPRPHRDRARIRQPRARAVPSARTRDRGLPRRAGSARQCLPARACAERQGRARARRRRLPHRDRGRWRRHDRLSSGRAIRTSPGTTASRSCRNAPAASAASSSWARALPVRGSSSVSPRQRRKTGTHHERAHQGCPDRRSRPVPPRPVRAARGARRHQGPGDDGQRGRGRTPPARRAPGPRDHGSAHGPGRRPPFVDPDARRRHRHAGGRSSR